MADIEVTVHREWFQPGNPAVNVRPYGWPRCQDVCARYALDVEVAERIYDKVFEEVAADFWGEFVPAIVKRFYGDKQWRQEGRSGGWLVVLGFRPVEEWHRPQAEKWRRFETAVKAEISRRCTWEYLEPMFTELVDDI